MFIDIITGLVRIDLDCGESAVFTPSDIDGIVDFLSEFGREGEGVLCSSSCDAPQSFGAAQGWSFDAFWQKVCLRLEGPDTLATLTGDLLT